MRFELNVLDNGLDVTVMADLPSSARLSIRWLVRQILDLRVPPNRAALRLVWGFAELADKEGGAVLIPSPIYHDYTVQVAFANRKVYTMQNGRMKSISFDDF